LAEAAIKGLNRKIVPDTGGISRYFREIDFHRIKGSDT